MKARSVTPDRKYLFRMRLIATMVALAILAGGILLGMILTLTGEIRLGGAMALLFVNVVLNGLWWLIALILYQALGLVFFDALGGDASGLEVFVVRDVAPDEATYPQ